MQKEPPLPLFCPRGKKFTYTSTKTSKRRAMAFSSVIFKKRYFQYKYTVDFYTSKPSRAAITRR